MELESEQQRHGETAKSMRRQERRLKELTAQLDEDRTTHERMHDVIDKLHQKLKTYKRQIDDAVFPTDLVSVSFNFSDNTRCLKGRDHATGCVRHEGLGHFCRYSVLDNVSVFPLS